MRKRLFTMAVLLAVLIGVFGVMPVASQGPDEPQLVGPLAVESSYVGEDKGEAPVVRLLGAQEAPAEEMVSVIIKLDDDSLAAYTGGVTGLAPTSPEVTGAELDVTSAESQAYLKYLEIEQESFISVAKSSIPNLDVTHRFDVIFGGVSALVPESQVEVLGTLPGVEAVFADELLQLDTEVSPEFIGATRLWQKLGGSEEAGEGVVVGVLDTGIWPEHPSFSDPDPSGKAFPEPPNGTGGYGCDFGSATPGDDPFVCNNKLIGAYRFMTTYELFGPPLLPGEFLSARDDDGHGTHTASTAAGNYGVDVTLLGIPRGEISGIAPRAHVIAYKVCGVAGCYGSDSAAAVQQAIIDGVDAINFSISGGNSPYSDAVELTFLEAYNAGVFVACSAGNAGPTADTVAHRGPWVTTVGASTSDRHFLSTITLTSDTADPLELTGASVTTGIGTPTPVVLAGGDGQCDAGMPPVVPAGAIVVCDRGGFARVTKSFNAMNAGAGGVFLRNLVLQGLNTDTFYIPGAHLEFDQGQLLYDYVANNTGVMATFTQGTATAVQGDVMAAFSSRGGPGQTLGISKPDVTAPGVQILAGNSPLGAQQGPGGMGPYGELFQSIQGTSMSSPHVAGAGALLKDMHPDWTPGQIKSALMTTAIADDLYKEDGVTPFDPFDAGSGRINLKRAGNPGLTFFATGQDFIDHQYDLWNANYPSLFVPVMPGQIKVERTAHSELDRNSVWRLWVDSPDDVDVFVHPVLYVPAGGDGTFEIVVDARDVPLGEVRHAVLYMRYRYYTVRFPITIIRRQPVVTLETVCDPAVFPMRESTDCTTTFQNTGFDDANVEMLDWIPWNLRLDRNSVVGADVFGYHLLKFDGVLAGAEPPEVTVGVGASPFGYLPLSLLGAPPNVFPTDESITNLAVDPFIYAGDTYASIGMVSNGYAVVGGGTTADIDYINQILPDAEPPNNVLAPFWTDLNPDAGGNYYAYSVGDGVNSWLVLEWENAPNYGDGEPNSFQIWIGLNGVEDITYAYGPALSDGDGGYLTVGAENAYGNSGANYYADGVGTLPTAGVDVAVTSIPGAPGETHVVTYTAQGRWPREWKNCVNLEGDIFFGTNIACFSGEVTRP